MKHKRQLPFAVFLSIVAGSLHAMPSDEPFWAVALAHGMACILTAQAGYAYWQHFNGRRP